MFKSHVSEYGIHWNFYTTIFVINFFLSFVTNVKYCVTIALVLMIIYEFALTQLELREYIFYAPRTNLFNGNREGIFSSIGYFEIMLLSMEIGR